MANKNIKTAQIDDGNEIYKLIKLVIIVTIIFLSFYLITFFVNKKDKVEDKKVAHIQYKEILIGNLLEQPQNEYYVMINDKDDFNTVVYNAYLNLYEKNDKSLKCYTSELKNPLNKNFVADTSNFSISKITDLKLKSAALIKIKDGNIIEYYENENIINQLKEMTKKEA